MRNYVLKFTDYATKLTYSVNDGIEKEMAICKKIEQQLKKCVKVFPVYNEQDSKYKDEPNIYYNSIACEYAREYRREDLRCLRVQLKISFDVINEISEEIKQDIINVVKVLLKLTDHDLDLYTTVSEELIGKVLPHGQTLEAGKRIRFSVCMKDMKDFKSAFKYIQEIVG